MSVTPFSANDFPFARSPKLFAIREI